MNGISTSILLLILPVLYHRSLQSNTTKSSQTIPFSSTQHQQPIINMGCFKTLFGCFFCRSRVTESPSPSGTFAPHPSPRWRMAPPITAASRGSSWASSSGQVSVVNLGTPAVAQGNLLANGRDRVDSEPWDDGRFGHRPERRSMVEACTGPPHHVAARRVKSR